MARIKVGQRVYWDSKTPSNLIAVGVSYTIAGIFYYDEWDNRKDLTEIEIPLDLKLDPYDSITFKTYITLKDEEPCFRDSAHSDYIIYLYDIYTACFVGDHNKDKPLSPGEKLHEEIGKGLRTKIPEVKSYETSFDSKNVYIGCKTIAIDKINKIKKLMDSESDHCFTEGEELIFYRHRVGFSIDKSITTSEFNTIWAMVNQPDWVKRLTDGNQVLMDGVSFSAQLRFPYANKDNVTVIVNNNKMTFKHVDEWSIYHYYLESNRKSK